MLFVVTYRIESRIDYLEDPLVYIILTLGVLFSSDVLELITVHKEIVDQEAMYTPSSAFVQITECDQLRVCTHFPFRHI
jgi:hypothetical protein